MIQFEDARHVAAAAGARSGVDAPAYPALVAELQPVIDAIAASLNGRWGRDRAISVTLPAPEGRALLVSVRSARASTVAFAPKRVRGLDARQVGLVMKTIDEKLGESISVSMLSAVAGLSRSHFSHAFRRTLGRTPHAHIVRTRLDRAMKLMLETDVPLSEIALAVGFADQAHFSNKFRRACGTTPAQWRKSRRSV
jgi:AraC-like DNA-binding protein